MPVIDTDPTFARSGLAQSLPARPQDPFERWAALQAWSSDATNRLDPAADLAFWERVAEGYDADALAVRVPAVLERVRQLVPPGASLLEVGAGTGAFGIPLARQSGHVTALDHSPAMLRVLERTLRANPVLMGRVTPVLANWEDPDLDPGIHDVVLAANALYRTRDPRLALSRLVAAARRRGIVVWSVGRQDAPQRTAREQVQPGRYRPGPDYIHVVEGLFALDVFAHVELIAVDDTQRYATTREVAEGLLSWSPIGPDELARLEARLPNLLGLERDAAGGWRWRRRGRIAVIWWDGPDAVSDP